MNDNANRFKLKTALWVGLAVAAAGCATANKSTDPRDPWEGWNRSVQGMNDQLDDYVMKPVAHGYQYVTPKFVDRGVTNFFSNVDDINVIVNDVLQFKLAQTGMDGGRLIVNTAAGLGGFVDVASKLGLPKHNEDLDQTLGSWGLPSGPYVVLPFFGPSTPRGLVGVTGDSVANPINWVNPSAIAWGTGTLKTLDTRADLLSATRIMDQASVDRYEFIRNAYFQDRNYKIYDGNPPAEDDDLEKEMDALEHLNAKPAAKPK